MDSDRMAALLQPFLPAPLTDAQVYALSTYLELLLRWNARTNLTAVRDPESIVTRHIGESLFAAIHLLEGAPTAEIEAIDLGSGAGFPGIPLKVYGEGLKITLIESQGKKATFLREVIRTLRLADAQVFAGRAETFSGTADLVTLRAVEKFDNVLPIAASLLRKKSVSSKWPRLGLLIGASQVQRAQELLAEFTWLPPVAIPQSEARVLLIGMPG